jgi:secondary thiamine-phosphate synthase enzyme
MLCGFLKTDSAEFTMRKFTVATHRKREILDITDQVGELLPVESGVCCLNVLHTTAALATADLDPGTDLDMLDAFEALMPKLDYRHPHNPEHVPDHILSTLIGTELMLPVESGALVLGTWQRIILVELDGPRRREMTLQFLKSS